MTAFTIPGTSRQVLQRDFRIVPKPERFGDVILYSRPEGGEAELVHMCVYIADDIVFTKNGHDPRQPWVLMRWQDMLVHYPVARGPIMTVFRRLNWHL